jgi:uncharacterized protein
MKLCRILFILIVAISSSCISFPRHRGFMLAVYMGDVERVRQYLEDGKSPNSLDYNGWPAIVLASFNRHEEVVKLLLDHGADIDGETRHGGTALLYSVGNVKIADLLIRRGADINKTYDGDTKFTVLMSAAIAGEPELVSRLLDAGADAAMVTSDGETAYDFAVKNGNMEAAALLKESARLHAWLKGVPPSAGVWDRVLCEVNLDDVKTDEMARQLEMLANHNHEKTIFFSVPSNQVISESYLTISCTNVPLTDLLRYVSGVLSCDLRYRGNTLEFVDKPFGDRIDPGLIRRRKGVGNGVDPINIK